MGELELRHFARRIGILFALIAGLLVFGTIGLSLSEGTNVLGQRNLIRGKHYGLPSGQDVARAMGIPVSRFAERTGA